MRRNETHDQRLTRILAYLERRKVRKQVRRLLGYDDSNVPAWVRRVHMQQVASFGSGNGRVG